MLFADGSVSTGQAPCADSGDWPHVVAGAELLLGTIRCSSVGHGRNGCRRKRESHSRGHDKGVVGEEFSTRPVSLSRFSIAPDHDT